MSDLNKPGTKAREMEEGYHSVLVCDEDGTCWSNETLMVSDTLYGPLTPKVDHCLKITRGVLTVVPADTHENCYDLRPDDDVAVLVAGKTYYLLSRRSVACLLTDVDESEDKDERKPKPEEDKKPAPKPEDKDESEADAKPAKEPAADGATPPPKGELLVPPRPAPPRSPTAHTGAPSMPRSFFRTPLGTPDTGTSIPPCTDPSSTEVPPDGASTPDDTDVPPEEKRPGSDGLSAAQAEEAASFDEGPLG